MNRLDQLATGVSQTIIELIDTSGKTSLLQSVNCFSETSDVLSDVRTQLALAFLASSQVWTVETNTSQSTVTICQIPSGYEVKRDGKSQIGFAELGLDHVANKKALDSLAMQTNLFVDVNDDAGLKGNVVLLLCPSMSGPCLAEYPELNAYFERNFPQKQPWERS